MTFDPIKYDQVVALNNALAASRQVCATYIRAAQNYEKGIKRLRKGVWRGQRAKERVRELEGLILDAGCDYADLDGCARNCDPGQYQIHAEARMLKARRK